VPDGVTERLRYLQSTVTGNLNTAGRQTMPAAIVVMVTNNYSSGMPAGRRHSRRGAGRQRGTKLSERQQGRQIVPYFVSRRSPGLSNHRVNAGNGHKEANLKRLDRDQGVKFGPEIFPGYTGWQNKRAVPEGCTQRSSRRRVPLETGA